MDIKNNNLEWFAICRPLSEGSKIRTWELVRGKWIKNDCIWFITSLGEEDIFHNVGVSLGDGYIRRMNDFFWRSTNDVEKELELFKEAICDWNVGIFFQ